MLSGTIKGFEIIPYPYLTKVKGLPEAVGKTYEGKTLFTENEDGTYSPNYKESMEFLEMYFDGGVQHSIADTFIAAILTFVIWNNVRKFIEIK